MDDEIIYVIEEPNKEVDLAKELAIIGVIGFCIVVIFSIIIAGWLVTIMAILFGPVPLLLIVFTFHGTRSI